MLAPADTVFEGLACGEGGGIHRGYVNALLRVVRVDTSTRLPVTDTEGAEAGDSNGSAGLELLGDDVDGGGEHVACVLVTNTKLIGQGDDELLAVHRRDVKIRRLGRSMHLAGERELGGDEGGRDCRDGCGHPGFGHVAPSSAEGFYDVPEVIIYLVEGAIGRHDAPVLLPSQE